MKRTDPYEMELLEPATRLFPDTEFDIYCEVKLGWRRIDLLAVGKSGTPWIAVELKVSDWKTALKQAYTNYLVAEKSYVAIWHKHIGKALNRIDLFRSYGVGIISISESSIEIIEEATGVVANNSRQSHKDLIMDKLANSDETKHGYSYGSASILST